MSPETRLTRLEPQGQWARAKAIEKVLPFVNDDPPLLTKGKTPTASVAAGGMSGSECGRVIVAEDHAMLHGSTVEQIRRTEARAWWIERDKARARLGR